MRLTNLADYAVVLACRMPAEGTGRLSAKDLTALTGIPLPTVSKITGALAREGLLKSQRGINGGFFLARAPEDISVADIVEAVEGPIALTNCVDEEPCTCVYEDRCAVRPQWGKINEAVRGALGNVTLADMTRTPEPAPRRGEGAMRTNTTRAEA